MSATSVSIDATFADGKPLSVLADLVAKREQYLKGETTEMAVTATAINILSSVRAETKVADPNKDKFGFSINPAPGVVAGFKSEKGSGAHAGRRVVRAIGGHEMSGSKIVNLVGNYKRKEKPLCFVVIHKSPRVLGVIRGDRYDRHYVIANSAHDVRAWATKKMQAYVRKYAGMAKWAIGQAQSRIAAARFHGKEVEPTGKAKAVALRNLIVNVSGAGYSSGSYTIEVGDNLNYATLALKSGNASLTLAMQKAANRTAAIINRLGSYRLDEPIPTPFPEVTRKR